MPSTPSENAILARLSTREAELIQAVASARERASDAVHEDDVVDRKDEADARARAEIDTAEIERDLHELDDIALARARVLDGSYGVCMDCGRAIDQRRLQAQPAACRCTACQAEIERHAPSAP